MVRAIWLCRHHDRIVISTKLPKLRHNFRIVKIRFGDCRFQIVRHTRQRHAAKIAETIFQRPDEILRILMIYRLTVGLAGIAQNNPEYPSLALDSICPNNRRSAAKINLDFFAWKFFNPAHRIRMAGLQAADKTLDRIVTAGKTIFAAQILINAPDRQLQFQHFFDPGLIALTEAWRTTISGGRVWPSFNN